MEPATKTQTSGEGGRLKTILSFVMELNWFLSASAGLVAFLLVKRYCFDIRRINSADMRETLYPGDVVLIRKIGNNYITGDIVYFEFPLHDTIPTRLNFIQRIFGMPGDSIIISGKEIFVNGMKLADTATVKHNYLVSTKKYKPDSAFNNWYGLYEGGPISDAFDYSYSLTKYDYSRLGRDTAVKKIQARMEKAKTHDPACFPHNASYRWNRDHYGPFYVPKKNDTLALDSLGFALYGTLITELEKNHVERRSDSIFINGRHSASYVVKKDYYFMLADNRDNANDSRAFGLVPANMIRGKVTQVVRRTSHEGRR
jgi:signal peptidase I